MNIESAANHYFREIMNKEEYEPIADNDQVKELINTAQKGYDKKRKLWLTDEALAARDIVIKRNLRLVPFVLHKVKLGKHHLFMDCVSEGVFSLNKCVIGYDVTAKTSFVSYAQQAIRRHMWRYLREHGNAIKLPAGEAKKRQETEAKLFSQPNGLDKILRLDYEPVHPASSLDYNFDDGKKVHKSPFKDIPFLENPSSLVTASELRNVAVMSLQCLTDRERLIIDKRILNDDKIILNKLAEDMGVTRERVRQIEKEALLKMKNWISYHSEEVLLGEKDVQGNTKTREV